jgi:tetratricopeptide (TPR) repeat protein
MSAMLARFSKLRSLLGSCVWLTLVAVAQGQTSPVPAAQSRPEPDPKLAPLEQIRAAPVAAGQAVQHLNEQPEVRNLYEAAATLLRSGNCEAAEDRLNAALNRSTADYYELLYLMANVKFRLGADGEARVYASQAAQVAPEAADAHYLLGEIYRRQTQLDAAIAQYRAATLASAREADNPRVTAAWFHLGECLDQSGWLTAAYEAYTHFDGMIWNTRPADREAEEVAALLTDRPLGMIQERVELLRRLERYEDAITISREALVRWPESVPIKRILARTLLAAGRSDEAYAFCCKELAGAVELLSPASDLAPRCLPLLSDAVRAARPAGQLANWISELAQQVQGGKQLALAAAVADELCQAGEYSSAVLLWEAIAAQRPKDPEPVWAAAVAQRAAGDLAGAAERLIRFIHAHPDAGAVPWKRFTAWVDRDEGTTVASDFLEQQAASPERDFAANFVLATIAARAGQADLAGRLFWAAERDQPEFALTQVAWAQELISDYEWEPAKMHVRAALEQAPDLAAAHFVLAVAHAGLDENDTAASEYRAAIKSAPRDPDYLIALGHFYKRRDDLLGAQRYFQQALAADPNNGDALENLVESYLGGGKPGLARAQFHEGERADLGESVLRRIRTTLRFADAPFGSEHLAELKRQFAADPNDLETGLKLAAGLLVRGRYDEAFPYAQALQAAFPRDQRAAVVLARLLGRKLQFDTAAELLGSLAERYPNRAEVLKLLMAARLADFQLGGAREVIEHLLDLAKTDAARTELRRQLLISYVEFSDFEPALQLLDEWTAAEPDNATWWREKLRVLALAGREQEALDLAEVRLEPVETTFQQELGNFKRLLDQYKQLPEEDRAMRSRAESLQADLKRMQANLRERRAEFVQIGMQAKRYEDVETRLRDWLVEQPGEAELTQWLVLLLIKDERPEEALNQLEAFSATGLAAETALRGWRADAEAAAGRVDKAVRELETLLEDSPAGLSVRDRAEVWAKLVEILIDGQRYDDALARCDQWLSELPAKEQALRQVVQRSRLSILAAAGWQDQYLAEAERLLEAAPGDTGLNNDLGYSWIDAGVNVERALGMIREAVSDEPLRAAYLDSLGWAYYKTGDLARACEYLRRAARLREGQDAVIFDHLGDAVFRTGDREAARAHWQKALELVEEAQAKGGMARPPDLAAKVRAKLAALADGKDPEVAPTAGKK